MAQSGSQICATATALPLAIALCGLTVWNGWLLSQNLTTIEYHEVAANSPLTLQRTQCTCRQLAAHGRMWALGCIHALLWPRQLL